MLLLKHTQLCLWVYASCTCALSPPCRSCCSTRRTSRAGWSRSRMSVWTCVTVAWIECVVSLWSAARKCKTSRHTHAALVTPPLILLSPPLLTPCAPPVSGGPPSPALSPLSRLTSVGRCSSWRRESILAGIPGATPTAATASCPSGPSAWYAPSLWVIDYWFAGEHAIKSKPIVTFHWG